MRKLFFDTSATGHHSEYIGHLLDYLYRQQEDSNLYYFVLHPEFSALFPAIFEKARKISHVIWHELPSGEMSSKRGSRMRNSITDYNLMHRYAKKFKVDHVCFLDFHSVKYGGIFHRTPYTISGILFVHFNRLETEGLAQKWVYFKRYHLTRLLCKNSKIKKVFILNDEETASYMNDNFDTDVFQMLPDPIPPQEPMPDFDIHEYYGIAKHKKIFLHIGSLGVRKGTFEVMDSVLHFEKSEQDKVALLLVGKASTPDGDQVILDTIEANRKQSGVQVERDSRFVPKDLFKSLIDQCYCVLTPYKNTEYSSGILGHALAAHKMVIATDSGLLRDMVSKNGLGILIEKSASKEIYKGIKSSLDFSHKPKIKEGLMNKHHPDVFAEMVLNS